jgi:hypothetical protein
VFDSCRITRVADASGQSLGDAQPLFDLAKDEESAVGRHVIGVEAGDYLPAEDR